MEICHFFVTPYMSGTFVLAPPPPPPPPDCTKLNRNYFDKGAIFEKNSINF